ncbi:ComF family protein [Alkalibaculum bacchi]|uniref:ComF family protein n=1 Tax=Alkalibaculum bacchi TaxID=645887 RepID=A0A366I3Y6_9FIRM|nr:ComF family protein [Alkalibaculum bacchi]RBP62640.1 ComF family protein [Alkalibaculum bacchi]
MWIHKLLDLIFIPNGRCPICLRVIFFSDDYVCHDCERKLEVVRGNRCKKCGKEIEEEKNYCSDCISNEYHYEKGYCLYNYEGSIRKIIHDIKFSNCPDLAVYMGKKLGLSLQYCQWIHEVDSIIPVPLHENRMKTRGYNQSEKISWGIMQSFVEWQKTPNMILELECLVREKDTPHQLKLKKDERFDNVKKAFAVIDEKVIKEKVVLLIDDVYTTGATIDACSETLMKGGAKKVYFATLAGTRKNL